MAVAMMFYLAHAQNTDKEQAKNKPTKEQKMVNEHKGAAASKGDMRSYAHGEKKHVCTNECAKASKKDTSMREHKCAEADKARKHAHAHSAKGHKCAHENMKDTLNEKK